MARLTLQNIRLKGTLKKLTENSRPWFTKYFIVSQTEICDLIVEGTRT